MAEASVLVTGFGPFEAFEENPSALLAEESERHFAVIPVAFDAVDEFIAEFDPAAFDTWVMLGVGARSRQLQIELFARNQVGMRPDVSGAVRSGSIEEGAPRVLGSTLWTDARWLTSSDSFAPSLDAGDYLCNYSYYQALRNLPQVRIGFVHVPPVEALALSKQQDLLDQLLGLVETPADGATAFPRPAP